MVIGGGEEAAALTQVRRCLGLKWARHRREDSRDFQGRNPTALGNGEKREREVPVSSFLGEG